MVVPKGHDEFRAPAPARWGVVDGRSETQESPAESLSPFRKHSARDDRQREHDNRQEE